MTARGRDKAGNINKPRYVDENVGMFLTITLMTQVRRASLSIPQGFPIV